MAAYRYSQSEEHESSSDDPVDRSGRRQRRPDDSALTARFSQMTIARATGPRTRIEDTHEESTSESSDDSDTDVEISDGPVGRSHAYQSQASGSSRPLENRHFARRQWLRDIYATPRQQGCSPEQAVNRLATSLVQEGYTRPNAEADVRELLQPELASSGQRHSTTSTRGYASPPPTTSNPGANEQAARRRTAWAAYADLCQQGKSPQEAVDSLVTRLVQQGYTRSNAEAYVSDSLRPDLTGSSRGQVAAAPQGHYTSPAAHCDTQNNSGTTATPQISSPQGHAGGSGGQDGSSNAVNPRPTGSQGSVIHQYNGNSGSLGGPGGGGGPPPSGPRQIPCFIDGCNGRDPTISELLRGLKTHHEFHFCKKCCLKFDSKQDYAEHKYGCTPFCIAIHRSETGQLFQPSRNAQRHRQGPACPDWHQVPVPDRWEYLCYLQYSNRPTKTFTYLYGVRQPHGNGKTRPNRRKLATAQVSSIANDLREEIKEVKLQLSSTQEELRISRAELESSHKTIAKLRSQLKSSYETVTELQSRERSSQETITKLQSELQGAQTTMGTNLGHIWMLKNIIRQFLILQGIAPLNERLESSIRENAPELLLEQHNNSVILQDVEQFINPAVLAKLD